MTALKTTITAILEKMSEVKKPQRDFLTPALILFLSIRSGINFLQLERHSEGEYGESPYRSPGLYGSFSRRVPLQRR